MRCDYCGEPDATVHVTQLSEGEVKNLHLCATCAAKNGIHVDEPVSLADLLLKAAHGTDVAEAGGAADTRCPSCHMRLSDFRKTSRLGCPACYEAFADELAGILMGLHKSQAHVGKAPAAVLAIRSRQAQDERLVARLQEAIAAERFEEAARVRDELRILRAEPPEAAGGS